MMINEDLNLFNSMIIDVSIYNNTHIRFIRQSGVIEFLLLPIVSHSFLITDVNNKGYISNKPELITTNDLGSIVSPKQGDVYFNSVNGKTYIYLEATMSFKVIFDNPDNINSTIKVDKFTSGNTYYENKVVSHLGKYYRALSTESNSPTSSHNNWKEIDETDLFKEVCEDSAPKLQGYFDVSDTSHIETIIEASNKTDFLQNFSLHSGDINNLEADMTVRSNQALVMKYIHPDTGYRIKSIYVDVGFDLSSIGTNSYGSLVVDLGNQSIEMNITPTEPDTTSVFSSVSKTHSVLEKSYEVVNHLGESRKTYTYYPDVPLLNSTVYVSFVPNITPTVPIKLYNIKIIFEKEV